MSNRGHARNGRPSTVEPLEPRTFLAADLVVSSVAPAAKRGFPEAVIGGEDRGRVVVRITNQGDALAQGLVSIGLVARDTNPAGIGDTPILTTPARKLNLKPGASRAVPVKAE